MKVFAIGFNLYGQLLKPACLLKKFEIIFESEVIQNFVINYSYSCFHLKDSIEIFSNTKKSVPFTMADITKVASNDERIIVLTSVGKMLKLDYEDEYPEFKDMPHLLDVDHINDRIVDVSCGSKLTVFVSQERKLLTMANQLHFDKKDIVQIHCGREHCILLDKSGNVYTFGRGRYFIVTIPLYCECIFSIYWFQIKTNIFLQNMQYE